MAPTGYGDASADDDGAAHATAEALREIARLAVPLHNLEDLHL